MRVRRPARAMAALYAGIVLFVLFAAWRALRPPPEYDADGRVNVNTASEETLATLPNFGPTIIKVILAHRMVRGAYRDIEDLGSIAQFGIQRMGEIRGLVSVGDGKTVWVPGSFKRTFRPINVNAAGVEEFAAVPFIRDYTAKLIVDNRQLRGPYKDLDDMTRRLYGFGPEKIAVVRDFLTFGPPKNGGPIPRSASER